MRHEPQKIVGNGDLGKASLGKGTRVEKNSPTIETLGAIAELNSWLGVLATLSILDDVKDVFRSIQHDLADLAAQISAIGIPLLSQAHVARIEERIEHFSVEIGGAKDLTRPDGTVSSSFVHVARSVCWRAERQLLTLLELDVFLGKKVDTLPLVSCGLPYLNRLSDLLLVISQVEHRTKGAGDVAERIPSGKLR
jgi:cob(I)alamin adenosyltransferase